MDDEGVKEAIEAELRRIKVGKGCATVTEANRAFVVERLLPPPLRPAPLFE